MRLNKNKQRQGTRYASFYSQKGEYATQRVAEAIAQKSWRWSLLNLAWTAGPVTIIAIYVGHKIGFGGGPSPSQIVYFMGYTMVVGLLTLLASILRDALYQPKIEQEQKNLLEVIDQCFTLILHTRDLIIGSLPDEERKIMAAYYTLQTAGESTAAVRQAVLDLSGSDSLSRAVERISLLADQGIYSLIEDTRKKHAKEMELAREHLQEVAPAAFELLCTHMKGRPPSARAGRTRDEGFIQRTLDAADTNESSLMTLSDAYEMFSLAFELLNNRKIARFEIRYSGEKLVLKRKKALDNATKKYRVALRECSNLIRLLIADIETAHVSDYLPTPAGSISQLFDALVDRLRALPKYQRLRFFRSYQAICRKQKSCASARNQLLAARQAFFQSLQDSGKRFSVALDKKPLGHTGIYIEESTLQLNDSQKLELSRALSEKLEEGEADSPESVKEIAIEIATVLDELICIDLPAIQAAIESSNALQIGYLKASFTPATKVGWAHRVIRSMHANKKKASQRLASQLATLYGVKLSPQLMEALHENFGADLNYLEELKSKQTTVDQQPSIRIPELKPLPSWSGLTNPI